MVYLLLVLIYKVNAFSLDISFFHDYENIATKICFRPLKTLNFKRGVIDAKHYDSLIEVQAESSYLPVGPLSSCKPLKRILTLEVIHRIKKKLFI